MGKREELGRRSGWIYWLLGAAVATMAAALAWAGGEQTLDEVLVTAKRSTGLVGHADSATEGTVTQEQLKLRPVYRVGELLETVPGLIVTQHSGEGKANQYFLRGFNLDHGTDLEITLDDMPVNMRTHAHGQGYADLSFFIPELASDLQYRKGTYSAEEGDFATAGAVHINYFNTLPQNIASFSAGTLGDQRLFSAASTPLMNGNLLSAVEFSHLDGPWDIPDNFRKINAVLRYSQGTAQNGFSVTGMYLIDSFHATNQIPLRAVKEGLIDQYGAIDPADEGNTERYSFSAKYAHAFTDGQLRANAYVIGYNFRLYNDFDYSLEFPAPVNDQFKQQDHRHIYGGAVSYSFANTLWGQEMENTVGFQTRSDDVQVTLAETTEQVQRYFIRNDQVTETSGGLYAENRTQWQSWFRTVLGVRGDVFYGSDTSQTDVPGGAAFDDAIGALNSGTTAKGLISPKLALIFGPWSETEFYLSVGRGFHSDDVRGAVAGADAAGSAELVAAGTPQIARDSRTPLLTPATGFEAGVRSGIVPHLQASLALFQLDLESELTFDGDEAGTAVNRPSRRQGVEVSLFYTPLDWLTLDGDFAFSRARFTDADDGSADVLDGHTGSYVPEASKINASMALTVHDLGPWEGALEWRYFGPRALLEDGSVRSGPTGLVNARVGYKITDNFTLSVDIFNIFNSDAHQIDYYYESQLPGEPHPIADIHYHPVEPLSARFTASVKF